MRAGAKLNYLLVEHLSEGRRRKNLPRIAPPQT
jgi:hypothetical protein